MGRLESFKEYAADCVRRAEGEQKPEDKAILLNIALAWVRLAQQSEHAGRQAAGTVVVLPAPAATNAIPPAA